MKKKSSEFYKISEDEIINIGEIKKVKRVGKSTVIHLYANNTFGFDSLTLDDELAVQWKLLNRLLLMEDIQ